jgi:CubicO group peptidase (beta-lactamase class C family)
MREKSFVSISFAALLAIGCGDDSQAPGGSAPVGGEAPTTGGAGGEGGEGGSGGAPVDPRFEPLIAAIEAEIVERGAPGAAVAVIEGGQVTFSRGFGTKSEDGSDPVLPTTLFRIGSVNKVLTATALLKEVESGDLDLDAAAIEYVPDFELGEPTWAPQIDLRHLLTHSSGMSDFLDIDAPAAQQNDEALESYLTGSAFANNVYLMNPSGAFWNYSNPNFYLAGLVTEKATGSFYRANMKAAVFDPLGMNRTFFLGDEVLADGDYALGKTAGFAGIENPVTPDGYENAWGRPAGYASSNVLDMAKFVTFLMDGNDAVLSDATRAELSAKQIDTHTFFDLQSYGFGLFIDDFAVAGGAWYDVQVISHGGDIPGFAADIMYVPSTGFGLVTLANADGAHLRDSTAVALTTLANLPAPSEPPDLDIDPADFEAYVGSYADDFNVGEVVITLDGDDLVIDMPDLDAAGIPYDSVLDPLDPANFILAVQGSYLQLTFLEPVDGFTRYLRSRAFVGIRSEETAPPATPIPPALRRARVEAALRNAAFD